MGAEQSHEDINSAIRATANELQTRTHTIRSSRSGKLPESYKSPLLHPHRNNTRRQQLSATRQLRLFSSVANRSRVEVAPYGRTQIQDARPISPVQRQKTNRVLQHNHHAEDQRKIDEQLQLEAAKGNMMLEQVSSPPQDPPKPKQPEAQKGSTAATGHESARADALQQQRTSKGSEDAQVQGDDIAKPPAPVKRGRGRPPNTLSKSPKKVGQHRAGGVPVRHSPRNTRSRKEQDSNTHDMQSARGDLGGEAAGTEQRESTARKPGTKRNSTRAQQNINGVKPVDAQAEHQSKERNVAVEVKDVETIDQLGAFEQILHPEESDGGEYRPSNDDEPPTPNESDDSEDDFQQPNNSLPTVEAIHVNPEELNLGTGNGDSPGQEDDGQDSNEDNDEGEAQDASTGRKRRAGNKPSANTSAKRSRTEQVIQPEIEPTDHGAGSKGAPVDKRRLCGQWHVLCKVFKARDDVGVSTSNGKRTRCRIRLEDRQVKEIVKRCDEVIVTISEARDGESTGDTEDILQTDLGDIVEMVDSLYVEIEHDQKVKDDVKVKCIYFHLIPKLIELLVTTLTYYEGIDAGIGSQGAITRAHLTTLNALIRLILDLGEGAKRYENPDPSLALVRPVRNDILAPLKGVNATFNKVILRTRQAEEYRVQAESEARHRALEAQREADHFERQERARKLTEKWNRLHAERLYVQGGWNPGNRTHLDPPTLVPEYDEDGMPFQRIEVFGPRIGPPPALVEAARKEIWSMTELDALITGLREYSGRFVFESIFRRYCKLRGPLNRFNVTEIVTVAAGLKDLLTETQMKQGGEVEAWVKAIPNWTKGLSLGKENDEIMFDNGDQGGHGVDQTDVQE